MSASATQGRTRHFMFEGTEWMLFRRLYVYLIPCVVALFCMATGEALAQQNGVGKILPKRIEIVGATGAEQFAIPLSVFVDYGYGSTKTDSGAANKVDIDKHRITVGANFMTTSLWFWGFTLGYANLDDDGSAPFVPSIDTNKDIGEFSVYLARPITSQLLAGASFYFGYADGRTVYNGAVVNNEDSYYYAFSPFLRYDVALSQDAKLTVGGRLNVNSGDFEYDINLPPTASTNGVSLHFPVDLAYAVSPEFELAAFAELNQILSIKTFGNVPDPDRTTATLGGRATFTLPNGAQFYVAASHDAFDRTYNASRVNAGFIFPFYGAPPRP